MHMPVNVAPDFKSAYGLGFGVAQVANQKIIGHSGSVPGYRTNIGMVPALKLGVAVFTNTGTDPVTITNKALEILIPAFEHQNIEPEATPEQIAAWKPYIGQYKWMSMDDVLDVRIVKGHLTALFVGEAPETFVRLKPAGEHQFKMVGGHSANEPMRFTLDASGKVTGLWFGGYPYYRIEE
jgi:CubicO group peptidase (beta-lactamase class C family)